MSWIQLAAVHVLQQSQSSAANFSAPDAAAKLVCNRVTITFRSIEAQPDQSLSAGATAGVVIAAAVVEIVLTAGKRCSVHTICC